MTIAAATAYAGAHNHAIKSLNEIKTLINERAEALGNSEIRWTQACDMAHVAGKLAEILEFLKS